ncbi:hypothetical protein HMPREF0653_00103 [Prevotella disiens JCM 6334 = ATCC 29426]|uniref:Uncharacterized protein n=1 Tax=Prevotella disiens JCM 6334 = ATCC 29426 TaxID=1235811 RepID=A0ABN0NVN4_9BACT|nr:hypothetical protein HMPREF0653_00103 [Prevotella disiens JCM 6334 = ATCC 29426]
MFCGSIEPILQLKRACFAPQKLLFYFKNNFQVRHPLCSIW